MINVLNIKHYLAFTAEFCDKQAGDLCLDTRYGISGTCCSPYTCTSVTDKSSLCKGESLALGDACFDSASGVS